MPVNLRRVYEGSACFCQHALQEILPIEASGN